MTPQRIKEIAKQATSETTIEFTDRARALPDAFERAIRTALLEEAREEPDEEMIEAGCSAYFGSEDVPDGIEKAYRASRAVKARQMEKSK